MEHEQKRSNELEQKCQMLNNSLLHQQSISITAPSTIHNSNSFSGGQSSSMIMKNSLNKQPFHSNNVSLGSLSSRSFDQTSTTTATTTMAKNQTNYAELGSIGSSSNHEDCCSSQLIDDDIVMIDNGNNIEPLMSITNANQSQSQQTLFKNPMNQKSLNYIQSKLNRLIDDLERIDSKSRSYEHDCHSLRQRLLIEQDQNCQLRQESERQQLLMNELKEELQTTVNNYEKQLQAMSEHMAKLNETLTEQCEQIDVLRYEKSNNSEQIISDSDLNQKNKSITTISMAAKVCIFFQTKI